MKNENINTIQEAAVGKFDDIHVNLEALDDTQFTALIERAFQLQVLISRL
jgi:hypothetical protein